MISFEERKHNFYKDFNRPYNLNNNKNIKKTKHKKLNNIKTKEQYNSSNSSSQNNKIIPPLLKKIKNNNKKLVNYQSNTQKTIEEEYNLFNRKIKKHKEENNYKHNKSFEDISLNNDILLQYKIESPLIPGITDNCGNEIIEILNLNGNDDNNKTKKKKQNKLNNSYIFQTKYKNLINEDDNIEKGNNKINENFSEDVNTTYSNNINKNRNKDYFNDEINNKELIIESNNKKKNSKTYKNNITQKISNNNELTSNNNNVGDEYLLNSSFENNKSDFCLLYSNNYHKNVKDDMIFMESQLLIEKSLDLQKCYYLEFKKLFTDYKNGKHYVKLLHNKNEEDNSKNIKEKKNNENIELKSENYNLNNNMDENINEFLNKEEKNQNTDNNNINDLILDNKNDKKAELNNLEVNLEDNKSKENINENEEKNISFEDKKIIDLEKNNSNIEDIEDNKNNNENNDYISNNNVSNIENINNEEGNDNNNIYNKESNNIENITTQINQQKSDNYSKHIITTDFEELKKDKKEEEKKSESENKNSNQGDNNNNKEFSNNNNYEEYPDILCNIKENKESNENEQSILTIQSRDCLYYQNELEKLSSYIKKYYSENNSYPQSGIQFYLFGREIGHGAFGKVNLCLHIASGHLVAMKTFVKKDLKYKETKEKLKNEVEVLSKLHHPFINQILDSFETETHFFIVMEYICGDLLSFIRKRNKLNEASAKIIFKQIIEGLKYIHKKKIVHRDIKLDNILIDLTNTIKICDFGVSRKFEKGNIIYERCGTPAYIAPEIYAKIGYDGPQCDIWSAGVTLYYILSGNLPFRGSNIQELEKLIINGDYEEIKNVSEEANDIVAGMLRVDPKKRLTIDEILKHPWLNNIKLENRYNLNIFTEAEKNLLSKYDVDYLNSSKSDLIENFTYRNLLLDNNKKKISGNTKSIIYAPYNSCVNEDSKEEENINIISYLNKEEKALYDELEINNNICKFGWRVKQANLNYELSNNDDFDNGLMKSVKEEEYKNKNEKIENKDINHIKNKTLESVKDYEKIKIDKKILEHIEKNVGYDKKYLTKCLKKNIINYSTATYYLLYRDKLNDNNNY